ncbi:MAG: cell wall-binding repeat-containing protein, partial [Acidimicrobiia bacterium]|nr:cell wall-binding repeat-containing protein [Acidimicrobiia bacterium]
LTRLSPDSIVVVGGSGVVSDHVAAELSQYASTVTRLWGSDRYSTAAAICQAGYTTATSVVYVGVGDNFPDALAAGPVAGIQGGPILLTGTDVLPSATIAELSRIRPDAIVIVGGTGVVSSAVEQQLGGYLAP